MNKHLKEYLAEKTSKALSNDTSKNFGGDRKNRSSRVTISNMQIVPSERNSIITVKAKAKMNQNTYDVAMRISDVKFVDRFAQNNVKLESSDGTEFYIETVNSNAVDVQVSCTCLDFYYMFADWNSRDDALIGNPPPMYVKKTQRPFRNPNKTSGLCKHIMKLETELELAKIIQ